MVFALSATEERKSTQCWKGRIRGSVVFTTTVWWSLINTAFQLPPWNKHNDSRSVVLNVLLVFCLFVFLFGWMDTEIIALYRGDIWLCWRQKIKGLGKSQVKHEQRWYWHFASEDTASERLFLFPLWGPGYRKHHPPQALSNHRLNQPVCKWEYPDLTKYVAHFWDWVMILKVFLSTFCTGQFVFKLEMYSNNMAPRPSSWHFHSRVIGLLIHTKQ